MAVGPCANKMSTSDPLCFSDSTYVDKRHSEVTFSKKETEGKIILSGKNADLIINGKSLAESIQNIEERLSILSRSLELESRWSDLAELGKQYRALEKDLLEKEEAWQILKQDNAGQ